MHARLTCKLLINIMRDGSVSPFCYCHFYFQFDTSLGFLAIRFHSRYDLISDLEILIIRADLIRFTLFALLFPAASVPCAGMRFGRIRGDERVFVRNTRAYVFAGIFVGGHRFSASPRLRQGLFVRRNATDPFSPLSPQVHSRVLPPPMQLQSRVARSAHVDRAFSSSYQSGPLRGCARKPMPTTCPRLEGRRGRASPILKRMHGRRGTA
jgi:hypothetical protein